MTNAKSALPPMHKNNRAQVHVTRKATKFVITKNGPSKSRPWAADIVFDDGTRWTSWSYGYKTKKGVVEHCQYVRDTLPIVYK